MRTPKFTAKRALGLAAAAAIAVTGTVSAAGTSQAAVQSLKLNVATVGAAANQVITMTGKDFQTAAGTAKIDLMYFTTATSCTAMSSITGAANIAVTPANVNIVSATKATFLTPSLASFTPTTAGVAILLCAQNSGGTEVVGSAKLKLYKAPVINSSLGGVGGVSSNTGAVFGGSTITITGENFSTKTTATIGGKALTSVKVVKGTGTTDSGNAGDDTLTGTVPAGTGTGKAITVTGEGGSVSSSATFSYLDALKVSPAVGSGADNNVITLTGVGFKDKSFVNLASAFADTKSLVAVVPAASSYIAGTTTNSNITTGGTAPKVCDTVQVVSDTELTCQLPDLTGVNSGGYNIRILTGGTTNVAGVTAVSRAAVYTAAAF